MSLLSSPLVVSVHCGSGRDEESSGEEVRRLIQIRLVTPSLAKIRLASQGNSAVCIDNPDCSRSAIRSATVPQFKRQIVHNPSELANLQCFPANCPLWRQK